jgi:hypothetical protein
MSSACDEAEAQKILTRLLRAVDKQRNPRTKATLGAAVESWLRTHEAEERAATVVRLLDETAPHDVRIDSGGCPLWRRSVTGDTGTCLGLWVATVL